MQATHCNGNAWNDRENHENENDAKGKHLDVFREHSAHQNAHDN